MSSLEQALVKIARILRAKKIPYMVIGGVANLFFGIPRTTLDIDITIRLRENAYERLFKDLKKQYRFRVKDPMSFVAETNVLPLEDFKGIRLDLIFAKLPYELQAIRRSKSIRVYGEPVRICSPEDLIVHKIVSDRSRDREDVRGVISSHRSKLNRKYLDPIVQDLALSLAKPDMLKFYRSCFR